MTEPTPTPRCPICREARRLHDPILCDRCARAPEPGPDDANDPATYPVGQGRLGEER